MSEAISEVDGPHLTVRLYENLLKIDLKGSLKNEIEEALENKPILKETIGGILSIFVPLHIRLSDVDSVHVTEKGSLRIDLRHRRDIVIPLERKDSERLLDKLDEAIPEAKKKEMENIIRKRTLMLQERAGKHAQKRKRALGEFPLPTSLCLGVFQQNRSTTSLICNPEKRERGACAKSEA
jgi:hypothetical protein